MSQPTRNKIFFSYSRKDRRWLEEFQVMLTPLVRNQVISTWDDSKIGPGEKWKEEIKSAITQAKVAVLLVSPDFLASDFIAENELPRLLDAQAEGLTILWVAVRDSLYKDTAIHHYQAANDPLKPLEGLRPAARTREIVRICEKIKTAFLSDTPLEQEQTPAAALPEPRVRLARGDAAAIKDRDDQRQVSVSGLFRLVLAADFDEINRPFIDAFLIQLRKLTKDNHLTVVRVEPGSVALVVRGSREGFERLRAQYASGEVTSILGARILDARWLPDSTPSYAKVRINGTPSGDIEFLTLSEDQDHGIGICVPSPRRLLAEKMVAETVRSSRYDEETSLSLFELLIPDDIKDLLLNQAALSLVVDVAAAPLPWEILAARGDGVTAPLALGKRVIREFLTLEFLTFEPLLKAFPNSAFIVGDTAGSLSDLPGAQQEAQKVVDVLSRANFQITEMIKPRPLNVLNGLFRREHGIIHIASHGVYNFDDPGTSGILLDEGLVLNAKVFAQLAQAPHLVFINCCHPGSVERSTHLLQSPNEFAATMAQELISIGVSAVIIAGWAVDSVAASAFAATFYEEMLKGQPFGEAIFRARRVVAEGWPDTNTWAAYQCYGNPDFTLAKGQEEALPS